MLTGLGVAWFFRRPSTEADLAVAVPSDPLVCKQPEPRTLPATNLRLGRRSRVRCRPLRGRGEYRRRS